MRFVFGASLALAAKLAALLPAFADYRIERTMLLSTELLRGWASGWLGGTILAMLLAGFAAAIVLRLADVTHQWYMYTIAAIFAVTFAAAILNPLVSRGFPNIPLDARHAATIQSLERANGVSVDVREFSVGDRTPPSEALLLGLGPTVRLMVSDLLVATATPAEFRFAVERQLAHVRRGDPARDAFMQALLLVFGTALAVFVADRVGFRRDDDPVSRLALVGALLACVYVLAAPLRTSFERGLESRADSEAAATIGDRTGAIREIVRSVDQRLAPLCPGVLDRAILADRDAAGARISALQDRPNVCP